MKLGIVGLPNVGKSTLFNAITRAGAQAANYPFCTIEPNTGVVPVPDKRLDELARMYQPKKVTPATVEFVDIAGLVKGASRGDQIENAASFAQRGLAKVLLQENMTPQTLQAQLRQLYDERADYIRAMQAEPSGNGLQAVLQILEETAKP